MEMLGDGVELLCQKRLRPLCTRKGGEVESWGSALERVERLKVGGIKTSLH